MTAPNDHAYDTDILETLSKRVIVGDGAMGTQLQAADLSLDDVNNRRAVLRRPPLGELLQSANDMTREYTVIERLARAGIAELTRRQRTALGLGPG